MKDFHRNHTLYYPDMVSERCIYIYIFLHANWTFFSMRKGSSFRFFLVTLSEYVCAYRKNAAAPNTLVVNNKTVLGLFYLVDHFVIVARAILASGLQMSSFVLSCSVVADLNLVHVRQLNSRNTGQSNYNY